MSGVVVAFLVLAALTVLSALMVVTARNPVVSAMWLALTLSAVAGLFVVLGAEFLAAIQLMLYAGAILVFFLFVVMLLNLGRLPAGGVRPLELWLGMFMALTLAGVTGWVVWNADLASPSIAPPVAAVAGAAVVGNTEAVATLLFSEYLVAFELTGVLLTAAVVGALVLAKRSSAAEMTDVADSAEGSRG